MSDDKTLKVSDWSQPIKIAIFLGFFIAVALFVWFGVIPWAKDVLESLRQIATNTAL